MKNLAGSVNSAELKKELYLAGVPQRRYFIPPRAEVQSSVYGQLGKFKFRRAWYYWVVTGPVPLNVAKLMYATKTGRTDVRVAGHCGCPPPEEWAMPDF